MKKLSDICAVVTSGQIMSRVSVEADKEADGFETVGQVKVIAPKAISNGRVVQTELTEVALTKEVDENRITKAGDIVVKLSTPYDAAYIEEESAGLVVTSFCAIISGISEKYQPEFLAAYLNIPSVRETLRQSTSGLNVPLLRVNDLKALQIPDVDLEVQKAAVKVLKLNQKKRVLLAELLTQCDKLEESVVVNAICREEDRHEREGEQN